MRDKQTILRGDDHYLIRNMRYDPKHWRRPMFAPKEAAAFLVLVFLFIFAVMVVKACGEMWIEQRAIQEGP